jgi:hypothetical protein
VNKPQVVDPIEQLLLALEVVFNEIAMDLDPQLIGAFGYTETFRTSTWVRFRPELQEALYQAYEAYSIIISMSEEDEEGIDGSNLS